MKEEIDPTEPVKPAQRLCNEIQLFDLCDLDRCSYREGPFCTNSDLLARFEWIADKEESPKEFCREDESDEDEESEVEEDFLGTHGFSEDTGEKWDDD